MSPGLFRGNSVPGTIPGYGTKGADFLYTPLPPGPRFLLVRRADVNIGCFVSVASRWHASVRCVVRGQRQVGNKGPEWQSIRFCGQRRECWHNGVDRTLERLQRARRILPQVPDGRGTCWHPAKRDSTCARGCIVQCTERLMAAHNAPKSCPIQTAFYARGSTVCSEPRTVMFPCVRVRVCVLNGVHNQCMRAI